jgi:hypothetical protein
MAPTAFEQPILPQQVVPFSVELPANSPAWTKSFQPSAASQKIHISVVDLQEVPSKRFV